MWRKHTERWEDALSVDFSAESQRKEEIKQALLQQLDQHNGALGVIQMEEQTMKMKHRKRMKRSSYFAVAACLLLVVSVGALAVASIFNLGPYATYESMTDGELQDIMDNVQEDIFDQHGNPVQTVEQIKGGLYDADGNQLYTLTDLDGNIVDLQAELPDWSASESTIFLPSLEEAQQYLAFTAKAVGYVPEGYTLEGYGLYGSDGTPTQDSKYLSMYFYGGENNEQKINVHVRLMDEDTQFVGSGGANLEEITINGYQAVASRHNVDLLIGDVLYSIAGGSLNQEEVLRMAESLTW